jgi:hypothetical protein
LGVVLGRLSGTGQFLASVSFKPANPIALEGIAVDPSLERLYVLANLAAREASVPWLSLL